MKLGRSLRDALTARRIPRSNYIGHGTGFDVRSDLGTLNMSDVPVAMIEIGNMRNARRRPPDDAQEGPRPLRQRGRGGDPVVPRALGLAVHLVLRRLRAGAYDDLVDVHV